jgi:hypothetical protein
MIAPESILRILAAPAAQQLLGLLLEAHDCSHALGKDPWDFAVEMHALLETGASRTVLRCLLSEDYAAHAMICSGVRTAVGDLSLPRECRFMLTARGVELAATVCQARLRPENTTSMTFPGAAPVPHWDGERGELTCGGKLVKRFAVPAENQVRILEAFAEEGWPTRLDDPLPGKEGQDRKRRLQRTIERLNQGQVHRLLHFRGDGRGCGVCWGRQAQGLVALAGHLKMAAS